MILEIIFALGGLILACTFAVLCTAGLIIVQAVCEQICRSRKRKRT
jgi:hypothetical protein